MSLFSMNHSKAAYRADFAIYGVTVLALLTYLFLIGQYGRWLEFVVLVVVGLASWTLIEYAIHRFVMHGLQPFSRWHAQHHQRPVALICTPTIMSMLLIVTLIFLPALIVSSNLWRACALTLGVVVGYLFYSVTHHATHHWRADSDWLKQRKRWHALHHKNIEQPACFGVTSGFWDYVFRSTHHRKS
ncbi:sterol desaturase family protein [Paraglaciecola sp.]|uniref:sterol desaturase family protein n=1 Tax=Paraglaciecola sp. TaxID=1920173 RepID=UPI0030F43796